MAHFLAADSELASSVEAPASPSKHTPTPEQASIIEAACTISDNLIINALAGAAKTSTLVMIANDKRMGSTSILCLAFNKKIADEMRSRLPSTCVAMTLNSLGHKVWGQALGKRLKLEEKKNYLILKDLIDKLSKSDQDIAWANYGELTRIIGHAKSSGWVPEACRRPGATSLWGSDEEFFSSLDEELTPVEEKLVTNALLTSIEQSYAGVITFDDQLYMPTCFPARFVNYPLTMIDEAQDLSPLNHAMLEKIVGSKRLFAVGDPCQAIYGFRGAFSDSMSRLAQRFSMRELILSISFRCPKAVVREAQWRAPHMQYPDWAKEGSISSKAEWSVDDLTQDAVILCRNNAPIFRMAIFLLQEGRYPQIVGNDIGKNLIKAMEKLGQRSMPYAEAAEALRIYESKRLAKAQNEKAANNISDFCTCISIFLSRADTLGGAIEYAEYIMNTSGPIKMMTGHKSKGLEFHNVYILDRDLLQVKNPASQDNNLLYVMQTRAQENLTYVTTDGFIRSEPGKE